MFLYSLNIDFFLGAQLRKKDHTLFCLELYQLFTISENHITDKNWLYLKANRNDK